VFIVKFIVRKLSEIIYMHTYLSPYQMKNHTPKKKKKKKKKRPKPYAIQKTVKKMGMRTSTKMSLPERSNDGASVGGPKEIRQVE
jgi:hypothetical protein